LTRKMLEVKGDEDKIEVVEQQAKDTDSQDTGAAMSVRKLFVKVVVTGRYGID
jgi:alpha-D-ribose 1-methylphosphonate 5-phosphate C-P lyase